MHRDYQLSVFDLKTESKNNVFSSSASYGKKSIFRFEYSFIWKLHPSPGDIVKKTEGGPKLYHIENNLVLALLLSHHYMGHFCMQHSLYVLIWWMNWTFQN
jgi:hypothetical protein